MHDAYIVAAGKFLPGDAISNGDMGAYLGSIDNQSERLGRLILRQNKIATRYYVPSKNGQYQYNNADMSALAANDVLEKSGLNGASLDLLATSTTQGDLLVPGHASAVHAALHRLNKVGPLELANFQSVCASSVMATKAAFLNIKTGCAQNALVTGSEFSSRWFQPAMYEAAREKLENKEKRMAAEFLRWTLSDGAGALLLQNHLSEQKNNQNTAFKIDWIKLISLADRFDTCMYAGINGDERHVLSRPWSHYKNGPIEATQDGSIMLLQDMVLLKRILRAWVGEYLKLVDEDIIIPAQIDHLLCHYSAHSLREEMIKILKSTGGMIDEEKWYSNLTTKGNTGAAAIFLMLEEFMEKKIAKAGEKILCVVPESGRAMVGFMMLTAQ